MHLTLQLYLNQHWQDVAELELPEPERGIRGRAGLRYRQEYALDWMFRDDEHACSLNLPVELMMTHRGKSWFGFLEDIMPAGASRRYWVEQLGLQALPVGEQDSRLLAQGTIAPVGNLRIKEAVPTLPGGSGLRERRFALASVVERDTDFLEYAQQMGAASGGATGAGGEAPKLLLRRSADDEVWIDTWQDDPHQRDEYLLVKFPRGRRSQDDCDILRAEYHYYQELAALGVDTIATAGMRLIEGERYPSLWLPRFDTEWRGDRLVRHGLESVYSLFETSAGSHLNHFQVIRRLVSRLEDQFRVVELNEHFDREAFVIEWVKRDLINVAFGNSDNHGRNTALIKRPEGIWLAPMFDVAPMKADPEGITRTTRWGAPFEEGGEYDWSAIAAALDDLIPAERLMSALRQLAAELMGLEERLRQRGVPERILSMPAVGLASLDERLVRWGLQ
ncbi:type II toxin-antitoxin system HipA family toxin [Halomonas sp. ML-15]|uniref:type II toxin-antitoxin system HipA family toxin n=1 Tax=Halomonas sp. ML-15 TaxID=2773305 RepID=UPI0017476AE0|nr:HipA domain-containing protein [Halomonas sp. ML-15]MBD3895249.1 type II toxin-antitoxin system HipA family toxin [Halomonas sp. ML-15]